MHRASRTAIAFLLAILTSALVAGGAWAAPALVVVVGERSGAHEETVKAMRDALLPRLADADILILDARSVTKAAFNGSRVVVAVGSEAAKAVSTEALRQPVLHTLLPRESYEALAAPAGGGRNSAIYLDQPVRRQMALLAEALPDWGRVAILAGPNSQELVARLETAAREFQLLVAIERITSDRDIYPALQRLLGERAMLLAVPDSVIFNSFTIQNILLTSYRSRAPLVGFSAAYVRAGALLGLYSTPTQIGEQTADAVKDVLDGGALPPPQAPRAFEIGINQNVARSLGITLKPESEIAARMQRRETVPR